MSKKTILYGNKVSEKILDGVTKTAQIVGETLGPLGNNVILNNGSHTRVTKDGITVLKEVEFEDVHENIAASLLKNASEKTNVQAGDGTTSTCILAESIYRNGLRYCAVGHNKLQVRNGINKTAKKIVEILRKNSVPIASKEDLYKVALISSNHSEEIATILSDVFSKIGENGTIRVESGKGFNIDSKIVEGMQFQSGYISNYFVTNEKMESDFGDNPVVLIIDKKISSIQEIINPMQEISKNGRQILIIAENIEGDALTTLVLNKLRGLQICAVKSPSYGQNRKNMLEDIAILTGGKVISEETGLQPNDASLMNGYFGVAKRIIVTKDTCTIIGGAGTKEAVDKRIEQIKTEISLADNEYDKKKLQERLAKLDGGVGVITVGANTEREAEERRDLVDDAFCACKSALAGGVSPGGGVALIRAREEFDSLMKSGLDSDYKDDEIVGAKIVAESMTAPLKKILSNANLPYDLIYSNLSEKEHDKDTVFNVLTEEYGNMLSLGIIDPTEVVVSEIMNATSIAGLLLTTTATITKEPEPQQANPQMVPQMM